MNSGKDERLESAPDALEAALRNVTPRPAPPPAVEQAVYLHALQDWRQLRAAKKRRSKIVYWSAAAAVLMALLISPLFLQIKGLNTESEPLGLVENQRGSVTVIRGNERSPLAGDDTASPLFAEQSLITAADSGASIKWGRGNTVRVGENTELHLNSKTEIELVSGKLYVDIPAVPGQGPSAVELNIVTRFGSVRHVGTQFMVSSDASKLEVQVREGAVSIDSKQQVYLAYKGQQAILDDTDGVKYAAILSYGPEWQWAEQLAPAFVLEGRTLGEFLAWVGREAGQEIVFDSKAAEDVARDTVMHGSIDEEPLRALDLILRTNALSWQEQDGVIYLSASR